MSWQPSMNWQYAKQRAKVLTMIRGFFLERDVVEVETPLLSNATVTDVHLDPFITQFNYSADSHIEQSIPLYAQTSPEFAMKRLLASGYGCCFQICKAFRHEQHGRYHNPEFTMLEWYRLGFDHFNLMDEVAALLQVILDCENVDRISYQEVFIREVAIDPLASSKAELLAFISERGLYSDWLANEDSVDTLLQFIMSEVIEPNIGQQTPCFIFNFPASQASLAKISHTDPRVAERFECYFKGVELANGFNELTDANTQLERFQQDNCLRIKQGKEARTIDNNFIAALAHGLPDCAGVALGVDRLIMLALEASHIDQVLSFPIENA
ncbi:MAG: elongation factor P--(R)-beta-lysine ligase [Cognaticolwellia sp.]